MLPRPYDLHDRATEWELLGRFASDPGAGPRLGVIYGRRRQGKTTLIDAICEASGGFYWSASQQSSAQQLVDLSDAWSRFQGTPPMRFAGWTEALTAMLSVGLPDRPLPIALDEFSWLVEAEPSMPSLLQRLLHPRTPAGGAAGARMLLCGSDLGAMRRLVDAGAPLRGRTTLELIVRPFGYRDAAAYWGLERNLDAAFRLHSYIGGTPAYRQFAGGVVPSRGNVDRWVVEHMLSPASPLFREGRVALAEDQTLGDRLLYGSILAAISSGARSRGEIAATIGRESGAIAHPLGVLAEGGWIERYDDPLRRKGGGWRIAEPLVRFQRLVIEPSESKLLAGRAHQVWEGATAIVASRIHGPHLESLACAWVTAHAAPSTVGGGADLVGSSTVVVDGHSAQLDLVVSEMTGNGSRRVIAIGECKADSDVVGDKQLERLDATAAALASRHGAAGPIRRLLVSRRGFTVALRRSAERRADIELVDLERLYVGD